MHTAIRILMFWSLISVWLGIEIGRGIKIMRDGRLE